MTESKVPTEGAQRPNRGHRRRRSGALSLELEEEMLAAADDLRFEFAAKCWMRSKRCARARRGRSETT